MKRQKRGDLNEIPFKKQKRDHQLCSEDGIKNVIKTIDVAVLCEFIIQHCEWDHDALNEFIIACENNNTVTFENQCKETKQWLEKTDPSYEFGNECFFHFKYLKQIGFASALISKEFLNVFRSLHNLETLAMDECHFDDDVDINIINQAFENIKCDKITSLCLWSETYGNDEMHKTFTNNLLAMVQNPIKTLSMQISGEKQFAPNLSLLANSKYLTKIEIVVNQSNIIDIISDNFGLIKILKQFKSLNEIILNVYEILNWQSFDVINTQKMNVDQELLINTVKLIKLFEKLVLDLKIFHGDTNKAFGKLKVDGIITSEFVEIYDENTKNGTDDEEDVDDDAVATKQLQVFEMDFYGKDKLRQLLCSNFLKIAKKTTIRVNDFSFLKNLLSLKNIANPTAMSFDDVLENFIASLGITLFFSHQFVIYIKETDLIIIETLDDENKDKLKQVLPIYIKKWIKNNNNTPEKDEKEMDEEIDEDEENGNEHDTNDELCGGVSNDANKLYDKYDADIIRKTVIYTMLSQPQWFEVDEYVQLISDQQQLLYSMQQQFIIAKEMSRIKTELDKIHKKQSQTEIDKITNEYLYNQTTQNRQIAILNILITHFDTIYNFVGKEEIKTSLYFVNKALFELAANNVYKEYAKNLYKINELQFDKNKFICIECLNVGMLYIDRDDLYPLSLLCKLKILRFGMVSYNKYDNITTNDIKNCFKSWNKLTSLDLWHLNDDCGSKYNGNPLNAELTNTLFRASIKTLKKLHVAFYGKESVYSRWIKHTNKNGDYFQYTHYTDDEENKCCCAYPDFSILSNSNQSKLESFSFWTRRSGNCNQDIMNNICNEINKIKTVNAITIQFRDSLFAPDTNMKTDDFKALVLKWKNILEQNGKNKNSKCYGKMIIHGMPLNWFNSIIKNEENDWFWNKNKNDLNLECLYIGQPYFSMDDVQIIFDFMKLNEFDYVSKLFFNFLTDSGTLDYRYFGKIALVHGFYSKCGGSYSNDVILTQITNDNVEDVQAKMLNYIEKIDENGKSNLRNEVQFPSFVYNEDSDYQRDSDLYE